MSKLKKKTKPCYGVKQTKLISDIERILPSMNIS